MFTHKHVATMQMEHYVDLIAHTSKRIFYWVDIRIIYKFLPVHFEIFHSSKNLFSDLKKKPFFQIRSLFHIISHNLFPLHLLESALNLNLI